MVADIVTSEKSVLGKVSESSNFLPLIASSAFLSSLDKLKPLIAPFLSAKFNCPFNAAFSWLTLLPVV